MRKLLLLVAALLGRGRLQKALRIAARLLALMKCLALCAGCASAPLQKECRLCPGAPAHDLTAHLKKWGPARAGQPLEK